MATSGNAVRNSSAACLLSFLVPLAGAAPAHAATAQAGAGDFVTDLGSHAIAIAKDPQLTGADRQGRFQALMAKDFDLPQIAHFVLGRYWQGTTDSDKLQFEAAFGDYMARVYSNRFAQYSAKSFRVVAERAENAAATVVSTEIARVDSGEETELDWIVVKTPDSYKVVDISAGGTSLSRAQREEFLSVAERNGGNVSTLTQLLQSKAIELAAAGR